MPNMSTGMKLVFAFITLIIGVVLVGTIATQGLEVTDKKFVDGEVHDITTLYHQNVTGSFINDSGTNSTISITNAPVSTWKSVDCPLTNVVVANVSGAALTVDTDYTVDTAAGTIAFINTVDTNTTNFGGGGALANNSYIDYNYCADDYLNSSWGRTVLNLVAGFFAIAILLASVGLFFSIAKDYGLV